MAEYTDANLVQSELRMTECFSSDTNPSLSTVSNWIEEESAYVDNVAQKKFGLSSYSDKIHYDKEQCLYLKQSPLVSITAVNYRTSNPGQPLEWTTLTENVDFEVDYSKGVIYLLQTNHVYRSGFNMFDVTYVSGYEQVPLSVQKLTTKLVTNRALESALNDNVNARNDGGSISVGDISIVEPGSYGVASFNRLKKDIDSLKEELVGGFKVHRYV